MATATASRDEEESRRGGGASPLEFAKVVARANELEELYSSGAQQNEELRQQLAALRERAAATAAQVARERAVDRRQRAELEERLSEMEVSVKVRVGCAGAFSCGVASYLKTKRKTFHA